MDYKLELSQILKYFEEWNKNLLSIKKNIENVKSDEDALKIKEEVSKVKNEMFTKIRRIDDVKNEMLSISRFLKYKDRLDDLNINISIVATRYGMIANLKKEEFKIKSVNTINELEGYIKNIIFILKELIKSK